MSRAQGDCRSSSRRIALAYSLHGLNSRPKECSTSTLFGSPALAWHGAANASDTSMTTIADTNLQGLRDVIVTISGLPDRIAAQTMVAGKPANKVRPAHRRLLLSVSGGTPVRPARCGGKFRVRR